MTIKSIWTHEFIFVDGAGGDRMEWHKHPVTKITPSRVYIKYGNDDLYLDREALQRDRFVLTAGPGSVGSGFFLDRSYEPASKLIFDERRAYKTLVAEKER